MTRRHRSSPLARLGLAVLALALGSCAGLPEPVAAPEPPAISEPAPASAQVTLERADALFAAGDHSAAATAYGDWLRTHGAEEEAGRALFQQALAQIAVARGVQEGGALPGAVPADGGPSRVADTTGDGEVAAVRSLLSRLLDEYPASPYAPAAAQMLDWLSEAADLRQRLEALKRIDLGNPNDPGH